MEASGATSVLTGYFRRSRMRRHRVTVVVAQRKLYSFDGHNEENGSEMIHQCHISEDT